MNKFSTNNPIYSFCTENLSYLIKISLTKKTVLTVGASFDQAIYCKSLGAQHITNFDINEVAKHYAQLKLHALRSLTYQEFLDFFSRGEKSLNYKTYLNLKELLLHESKVFWDYLYTAFGFDGFKLRESLIFNNKHDEQQIKMRVCSYIQNEEHFLIAKDKAQYLYFDWISCDIEHLTHHTNNMFDVILLSNIADYSHYMFQENHLQQFKENIIVSLSERLKPKGVMMLGYVFDGLNIFDSDKRNAFNNKETRQHLYSSLAGFDYQEIEVLGAIEGSPIDYACFLIKN